MSKKRKKNLSTRQEAINAILDTLSWQDRKKVEEAGRKYRAPDLDAVERLYYRAHGLTELEIERRMKPMEHELKCWPEFFARLKTGAKRVEIRKNDRDYKVGDELILKEWNPEVYIPCGKVGDYTGESVCAIVTDIVKLSQVPGLKDGLKDGCGYDTTDGDYVALSLAFPDLEDNKYVFALGYSENVLILAKEMERELKAHASKGDHENLSLNELQCLDNLRQQVHELEQAMMDFQVGKVLPATVLRKAAGVSNYALFCVQVSGAIQALKEKKS